MAFPFAGDYYMVSPQSLVSILYTYTLLCLCVLGRGGKEGIPPPPKHFWIYINVKIKIIFKYGVCW
jgi:hypothetical protein